MFFHLQFIVVVDLPGFPNSEFPLIKRVCDVENVSFSEAEFFFAMAYSVELSSKEKGTQSV